MHQREDKMEEKKVAKPLPSALISSHAGGLVAAWLPCFKAVLEMTLAQRRVIKTEENVTASPTKQVQEGAGACPRRPGSARRPSTAQLPSWARGPTVPRWLRDRSMTRVHSRGTSEAQQTEGRPAMGSAHTRQRVTMPRGELCGPENRHARAGARRDSDRGGALTVVCSVSRYALRAPSWELGETAVCNDTVRSCGTQRSGMRSWTCRKDMSFLDH